jgi:hypothetical protein
VDPIVATTIEFFHSRFEEAALNCHETIRTTNAAIPKVPSSNIVGYLAADVSCVGSSFCDTLVRIEGAEVTTSSDDTADGGKVGIVDDSSVEIKVGVSVGIEVGGSVGAGVGFSVLGDVEGCVAGLPSSARLNTRTFPT